jgi:hypothetical protein
MLNHGVPGKIDYLWASAASRDSNQRFILIFRYVDEVQDNLLIDAWRKFGQQRLVVIGLN